MSKYDVPLDIINQALYEPDNSVIFKYNGLIELKEALEQAQRQETLLKLYQRLYQDYDDLTMNEEVDIIKQIKDLENE